MSKELGSYCVSRSWRDKADIRQTDSRRGGWKRGSSPPRPSPQNPWQPCLQAGNVQLPGCSEESRAQIPEAPSLHCFSGVRDACGTARAGRFDGGPGAGGGGEDYGGVAARTGPLAVAGQCSEAPKDASNGNDLYCRRHRVSPQTQPSGPSLSPIHRQSGSPG